MTSQLEIIFSDLEKGLALSKAVEKNSEEIVALIKESELKGRGGAGFPTGLKWEFTANNKETDRFIVCNADEGEPGTFKDRQILQEQTAKVIESMAIAAYAVKAQIGYIYLRGEYSYLKETIQAKIENFRNSGLLGKSILNLKDFNFDIEIRMGAGAYICGEETALLESLESKRGEPRYKPPFPVEHGFQNQPTVVNNVETLCYIPHIILQGADWFKSVGTKKSAGYKLFSVSGDCQKPGIYEFEFGITISELLKEVNAPSDTKAVQIGGAGGFCAAKDDFHKHICFEGIPTGGSIIIIGQKRNMLDILLNFIEFFTEESCGQCTPCREGNFQLYKGLMKFKENRGNSILLKNLLNLCDTMKISSKCGLGQSVPNSFRTIVEKFKDEILLGTI